MIFKKDWLIEVTNQEIELEIIKWINLLSNSFKIIYL